MFYKGIVLDLDDTIYSYETCHSISLNKVLSFLQINYTVEKNKEEIKSLYDKVSKNLKNELVNTASSHNKSIYFKGLLEYLNLNISILDTLNELYWTTFFDNIVCFYGVKEFIAWNKQMGVKIGILTDYETEYQIKKLNKLGVTQYIDVIVTSEEVGIEKPSVQMFQTILRKLKLNADEVIMIGDNFEKDIQGAVNMGIFGYWLHKNNSQNNKYNEFYCYQKIRSEFKEIHDTLNLFKKISKFAGERFDLVQAGGGNSSVKIGNWMFIKASGVNMTSIDTRNGYVIINNQNLLDDIDNDCVKDVTKYNLIGTKRASIETFMHAILKKYTLHLHPIQVIRILITMEAKNIIKELFPQSLIIDYLTPGIQICNAIKRVYNNEKLIFLINHGIIITSDQPEDIYEILKEVIDKFEIKQEINYDKYKYTNEISKYINTNFDVDNVSYLCENRNIMDYLINKTQLLKEKITFPDALIYCGIKVLFLKTLDEIKEFREKYDELPKIIVINNSIYINAISLNKCKEIEEVLLSNLIILDSNFEKVYLPDDEICFLNNWDAEKYRKLL